jgi:hypothetical protein
MKDVDVLDIRPNRQIRFQFHTESGVKYSYDLPSGGLIAQAKELATTGTTCLQISRTNQGHLSACAATPVDIRPGATIAARVQLPTGEADITLSADELIGMMEKVLATAGHVCAKFSRGADGRISASTWTQESAAPIQLVKRA